MGEAREEKRRGKREPPQKVFGPPEGPPGTLWRRPRRFKRAPRPTKMAPRSLLDGPKGFQEIPRWPDSPQESHGRLQERLQEAQTKRELEAAKIVTVFSVQRDSKRAGCWRRSPRRARRPQQGSRVSLEGSPRGPQGSPRGPPENAPGGVRKRPEASRAKACLIWGGKLAAGGRPSCSQGAGAGCTMGVRKTFF